ncbi:SGNH/GDSL hydrolase family protein [Cesiribacter sp. SM1]|uniref:SGNH/GDSL hydrolase family protein n=1 Tax=Cesiribacter sp. SM1 TaxID=2861196 RepID=UPI001CD5AE80|nr:SGNH/GDSL hydrolase family protein [Cesiribacter sp. SM1]
MRKFLIRTFLTIFSGFAFYCCIIWFALVVGLDHWLPNFHTTSGGYGQLLLRLREVKTIEDVDILFIGSSHVYRGFDPREFEKHGYTSFNLGSTSQTPYNSYYLLREYLPTTNPEMVVLDLYWNMLVQDGLESTIDIISNAELESSVVEMGLVLKNGLALNSMLINAIKRLHVPLHRLEQQKSRVDVYVKGGYTQTLHSGNTMSEEELESLEPMEFRFSDVQLAHLIKIIRMCKNRGIQLVFVVTPVTDYYKNKLVNYAEYASAIKTIASRHNIPLFDYNRRADLELHSLKEFYDEDHLTQAGVKKFNRLFINDLLANKIIKPPSYKKHSYASRNN